MVMTGLALAGGAWAQEPVGHLQFLVGQRASSGEEQLKSRGFAYVRTEKEGDSSYTFWRQPRTNRCVSVRTTDGKYAAILFAPDADCVERAAAPAPVEPPPDGEDRFDTVCGVETGGQTYRYPCRLRNEGCNSGGPCRTHLTLPDIAFTLTWHKDGGAEVVTEGMQPARSEITEQEGQTRFQYGGNTYFVYRLESRAKKELAQLVQKQ